MQRFITFLTTRDNPLQEQSTNEDETQIPDPPTIIDDPNPAVETTIRIKNNNLNNNVIASIIDSSESNDSHSDSHSDSFSDNIDSTSIQQLSNNNAQQQYPKVDDTPPTSRARNETEKATLARRLSISTRSRDHGKKNLCNISTRCDHDKTSSERFWYYITFVPTLLVVWYAAALLFPKAAKDKYPYLIWDDSQLEIQDDGQLSLCPKQSICSEGLMQIILIGISRLTAYASYVYVGLVFISKMNNLNHFLSSTYLQIYVPFHAMHYIHTDAASIYSVLILLHGLSHYIRYILRGEETLQQLGTSVHISGCIGIVSLFTLMVSMKIPNLVKKYWNVKFEYRLNIHWVTAITLVASLCIHNVQSRSIMLVFL
jgi:hypothetical protein